MGRRVRLVSVLACLAAAAAARGAPSASSISFGSHGDAVNSTSGQPVALSPTSLLVAVEGPDGVAGTADDEALLVAGIGGVPAVTSLPTPFGPLNAARIERLSATRAVRISSGPDGVFSTADDEVLVLDRLGSGNTVTHVTVGGLGDSQQFTPERLSSDRFAIPSSGTDLLPDTADDEVVVVTVAAAGISLQRLSAPYQRSGGRTRIIASSPTSFFIASDGPDAKTSNGDDAVHAFVDAGSGLQRTTLPVPGLNRRAAGRSVRLTSTTALVVSAGIDFKDSTGDDQVFLLDGAGGTATGIPVPYVRNGASAQPTVLAPDLAVVSTMGANGLPGDADDAVAILSGLGTTNTVTSVVVGPAGDNNECRPVALDGDSFALVTFGPDAAAGTADDVVTIVRGASGTPVVLHVVVGAVANGTASAIVPISSSALLVAGGGPDQSVGTSDDAVTVLSGIGSGISLASLPIGGALDSQDAFRYVPVVLGEGRAALLSSGPDDTLGTGGDDAVRVLEGLGLGQSLDVLALRVRFGRPGALGSGRAILRGRLRLENPLVLLDQDLTVSIGNASQTIPAGGVRPFRKGRSLRYLDREGERGILRSLTYDLATGHVRAVIRGGGGDLSSTAPWYVPLGFDFGGKFVPRSVHAKPGSNGFAFRKKWASK